MRCINLSVKIGKLSLKNPVMVASGTFGYAQEFKDCINLKELGAIVTKTITLWPRQGNPPPRTCETACGMLNSIGLENPGWEGFIKNKLPILKKIGIPVIVSIASEEDPHEFVILAQRIDKIREISAIELNVSCPNLKLAGERAGTLISQDPKSTYALVRSVRKVTDKTIITKLSPNVTEITEIAKAAESAGSDALSLVNTFYGMSIDIKTRKPRLGNVVGGLSGPAIKPMALQMVWQVYKQAKVTIVGMGGIMDAADALEFIIAGATCVAAGTANFINPKATLEIIKGLKQYLSAHNIRDINTLIGSLT